MSPWGALIWASVVAGAVCLGWVPVSAQPAGCGEIARLRDAGEAEETIAVELATTVARVRACAAVGAERERQAARREELQTKRAARVQQRQ